MSPDSVVAAGRIGAQVLLFSNRSDEALAEAIAAYRDSYNQNHDGEPPAPRVCDFMYCADSEAAAEEFGEPAIANYFVSVMNHYELLGDHFPKGYQSYQSQAAALQASGKDQACADYVSVQCCGTAEQIVERLAARRTVLGDFELNVATRFGGLNVEQATQSLQRFASGVLPTLRSWN
jgi:alkanesulfonate monooxygenase SsuD/methylene tetrahydromethanopterin reductase-like flavin-dependent oxidoreductase (luciferase family)